jgi:hypothetical protein
MNPVCKLYVRICRRKWGTTLSALAYLRARRGKPFWRNRIDGFFLLFGLGHQHCQASFQRNRASPTRTGF